MKECLDVDRPQINKGMNKLGRDKKRKNAFAVEQKMKRATEVVAKVPFALRRWRVWSHGNVLGATRAINSYL